VFFFNIMLTKPLLALGRLPEEYFPEAEARQDLQEELSQPVAVLLNEPAEVIALASQGGFRCFTSAADFKRYVAREIVGEGDF
jgi:hypothetical protein